MTRLTIAAVLLLAQESKPEDLCPMKEGTVWIYEAQGAEFQIKVAGKERLGDVECSVFETTVKENTQKEYFSLSAEGLRSHRVTAGERIVEMTPSVLRIKFPLKKGDTWEWKGKQGDVETTSTFTNEGEEEIVTKAGKYKAWKVVAVVERDGASSTAACWYASGVGMVRQDVSMNVRGKLLKMTTELKKFEAGK